jgi:RHS repeat-associated protein
LRTFSKKQYRYVGKEKDAESGLYYYGARYYSAWTCRFISVDPLAGKFAQLTPYNYSDNEPIGDFDIDGKQNNNSGNSETSATNSDGSGSIMKSESPIKIELNLAHLKKTELKQLNTDTFTQSQFDRFKNSTESGADNCIVNLGNAVNGLLRLNENLALVETFGNKLESMGKAKEGLTIESKDSSGKITRGVGAKLVDSSNDEWEATGNKPSEFEKSPAQSIVEMDNGERGISILIVSVGGGYHSMSIAYDNSKEDNQFYLMDQKTGYSRDAINSENEFVPISAEKLDGLLQTAVQGAYNHYKSLVDNPPLDITGKKEYQPKGGRTNLTMWKLNNY